MQLKTFKGPDMATALQRARREFGPGALVLATNEIRGRLGLKSIEITVGIDRAVSMDDRDDLHRVAREVEQAGNGTAPVRPEATPPPAAPRSPSPAPPRATGGGLETVGPALRPAVEALVRSGLSRDLALRFGRIASSGLPDEPATEHLATATAAGIEGLLSFRPELPRARVVFVVGPPGSGKTTTVAKLAARVTLPSGRPVIVASADLDRVGALEQARIYCRHIGARLVPVSGPADLHAAIEAAGPRGMVIVDTPGIGWSDRSRLREVAELRREVPEAEVALVLPCGLHRQTARELIELYASVRPTCAAFSKVDDAGRLGELVSALAPVRLPLAFVTTGQRVPDDLENASPRNLAARMLRSAFAAPAAKEARP